MLISNVVIWSPLLNFLVLFMLPLPPTAGCNWLELPLVVREQFFRRLVGYVLNKLFLRCYGFSFSAPILNSNNQLYKYNIQN